MLSYFIFIIVALIFVQLIFLESLVAKIILLTLSTIICYFLIKKVIATSNKFKENSPDKRLINLQTKKLSPDQKRIQEEYGNPIKIVKEESIEYNVYLWILKKNIAKFDEKGNLIKIV
jgi:hypothetical protein